MKKHERVQRRKALKQQRKKQQANEIDKELKRQIRQLKKNLTM